MKCVLRLIRSDLAAPGVVPPDNRVGYQALRQYNRHIRHNHLNPHTQPALPRHPNQKNLHKRHIWTRF